MSGPKSSSYTLTAEQRRRMLEEQRRQRELEQERKRVEAETKKKNGLLVEIVGEMGMLSTQIQRLTELKNESGYDLPILEETTGNINHTLYNKRFEVGDCCNESLFREI